MPNQCYARKMLSDGRTLVARPNPYGGALLELFDGPWSVVPSASWPYRTYADAVEACALFDPRDDQVS